MIVDHVDKRLATALNGAMTDQLIPATTTAFLAGGSYEARSACDHDTVWIFEVVARTAQYITIVDDEGKQRHVGVRVWDGVELASPLGTYSMAPVLRADRRYTVDGERTQRVPNPKCRFGQQHTWQSAGYEIGDYTVTMCVRCQLVDGTGKKVTVESGALVSMAPGSANAIASEHFGQLATRKPEPDQPVVAPTSEYRSLITVTLVLGIHEHDVRTNDLDAMASVTHGAADLVGRFYPHLEVVSCESSVSNP